MVPFTRSWYQVEHLNFSMTSQLLTNKKDQNKTHRLHNENEKHAPLFCLQPLQSSHCFFELFFSSLPLFIQYNYFVALKLFSHEKCVWRWHFTQNTTQLIWYVNENDDGIDVWLPFKLCVYTNNVFISNGMASLVFNFIFTWWHENQPLKCFKHVRYTFFPLAVKLLYILYLYLCVKCLRTQKHNWKYVCVCVYVHYHEGWMWSLCQPFFMRKKNRYYMTSTHISQMKVRDTLKRHRVPLTIGIYSLT